MAKGKGGKAAALQKAIGAGDHEAVTWAHARHLIDGTGGSLGEHDRDDVGEDEEEEAEEETHPAAKKSRSKKTRAR